MSTTNKKATIVVTFVTLFCCALTFSSQAADKVQAGAFSDVTWCTTTYNTDTSTVSFSIDEINGMGWAKNETDETIFMDLPVGVSYVPNTGTCSYASNGDIIAVDCTNDGSRITATVSTGGTNNQFDTIYFNDFQIFGTASGTNDFMFRNGGSLLIMGKAEPLSTGDVGNFGNIKVQEPMIYSSNNAGQPSTDDVQQVGRNNEI